MSINKETVNFPLSQLILWWSGEEEPAWAKTSGMIRESVAYALRQRPEGIAFLKSRLKSDDLKERGKALWLLSRKEVCDEEIVSHLIEAFRNPEGREPRIRFAFKELALNGLMAVEQYPLERSEVEELLVCEAADTKAVAAKAMVYLSRAFPEDAIDLLRAGLRSANPMMRANACTEAGFRNVSELRIEVADLRKDPNDYVARSAQIGCEMFDLFERKQKRA
jgi:hypothetical protein